MLVRSKWLLSLLLAVMLASNAACITLNPPQSAPAARLPEADKEMPAEFSLLGEVWTSLQQYYVAPDSLDARKLSEGAARGMLEAVNDPHTSFIDADSYRKVEEGLTGKFVGIGATVTTREGEIIVVSPFENSPAKRAGIRSGDKILEVNGESTAKLSLEETVSRIRGEAGTVVKLKILHSGDIHPVDLELTREEVKQVSVTSRAIDNLLYIRISSFSEDTAGELNQTLKDNRDRQYSGIILDLRENPGGILSVVVDVASQFVERGKEVVYQVDRDGQRVDYPARGGGLATRTPIVVLVNQYSASGSEVLSGALQDYQRALIVGVKTYGKGSVNIFKRYSEGSGASITVARWYTPLGRMIEGKGLDPDVVIENTLEDLTNNVDKQLDYAVDYLKKKAMVMLAA